MADPSFRNYHITSDHAGQAIAKALRSLLRGWSWAKIKRLLHARQVQVNGNLCVDETRPLKPGDVVKVWNHPLAKPADERDVTLVYVDAHLIVVEKPAGVTTLRHKEEQKWSARRKQMQPTLDELLPRLLAKHLGWKNADIDASSLSSQHRRSSRSRGREGNPADRGRNPPKLPVVRAVHRLDRDTSGLMVFARTPQAEQGLIKLFSKHRIERAYLAVVHGALEEQTIDTYLVRDRGDGLRGSSPLGKAAEKAQRAITHVKPIERLDDYTLAGCRLKTGRTHQIRIHLSERGHRLCGEKTYTHLQGGPPQPDTSGAPRQALHAAVLGFVHPATNETLRFRMPLPQDLAEWLQRLRERNQPKPS